MTRLPEDFVARLAAARAECTVPTGLPARAEAFARNVLALLFPHHAWERRVTAADVEADAERVLEIARRFIADAPGIGDRVDIVAGEFAACLPSMYDALLDDARETYDFDPAARSIDEVILAYPGFFALACYRCARHLWYRNVELLPRLVTEFAHSLTGIDIHPGARLGRAISIDHGTGIVIGETAIVGDRVRFYQGVTLGASSVKKTASRQQRHPTIEDDVVLYSNAIVLGGATVVGARSIIGGNVWLTHSVPPDSIVTEVPHVEHRPAAGEDRSHPEAAKESP